jgi:hypothetical protein
MIDSTTTLLLVAFAVCLSLYSNSVRLSTQPQQSEKRANLEDAQSLDAQVDGLRGILFDQVVQ